MARRWCTVGPLAPSHHLLRHRQNWQQECEACTTLMTNCSQLWCEVSPHGCTSKAIGVILLHLHGPPSLYIYPQESWVCWRAGGMATVTSSTVILTARLSGPLSQMPYALAHPRVCLSEGGGSDSHSGAQCRLGRLLHGLALVLGQQGTQTLLYVLAFHVVPVGGCPQSGAPPKLPTVAYRAAPILGTAAQDVNQSWTDEFVSTEPRLLDSNPRCGSPV